MDAFQTASLKIKTDAVNRDMNDHALYTEKREEDKAKYDEVKESGGNQPDEVLYREQQFLQT